MKSKTTEPNPDAIPAAVEIATADPVVLPEDAGLEWSEEQQCFLDVETGEALPAVGDDLSEVAVNRILFGFQANAGAIEKLGAAKKQIDTRIKARKRRAEWFKMSYLPSLRKYVGPLLGKAQSIALEFGTVGYRKQKAKIEILDDDAAALWALTHDPKSLTVTVAIGELNDEDREKFLEWADAVKSPLDIKCQASKLDEEKITELPPKIFAVTPGGDFVWFIK